MHHATLRFVLLSRFLLILLAFPTGSALAQEDGVSVPFSLYAVETQIGEGDDAIICVRIVVEWTHHPGTGSHYTAHGWGGVDGGGTGPRNFSLLPARTEVPASGLFPEVTTAQPGNLIYPLSVGQAPADNPDLVAERRNAIEAIYRASSYDWDVRAYGFDDFHTWVVFEPDTVQVGETFEARVKMQNRYIGEILDAEYDGEPLITSDDDGEVSIESGPVPGQIATLTQYVTQELTYTLIAEKSGTVRWDPKVKGRFEKFLPDVLYSTSLCGQYDFATCMAVIQGGMVVNDAGDAADLDPGDGICDSDADTDGAQCTLRAVIEETNALAGHDEIGFDLEGEGPFLISPESPLPAITDALTLDGATQPGTDDVPLIRIDGAGAGGGVDGITIDADDVTLRGLMITNFGGNGVHVAGGADGVLEGLIVGSNASGSAGMGNGGNGIFVDGGSGLRIGPSEEAPKGPTRRSAININLNVAALGNLLNGVYVRYDQNAAQIRAAKSGQPAATAIAINLTVSGLTAGLIERIAGPVVRPNGANGVCLYGVAGAIVKNLMVSDAGMNALEMIASQDIQLLGAHFGMRRKTVISPEDLGVVQANIMRIVESRNIIIGSSSVSDPPIQGGGASGWFMNVEDSDDVQVRNLIAGIVENMEQVPPSMWAQLKNRAGGLMFMNSPGVQVGMSGVPTVLANNGGDASQPQAGIFAAGPGTEFFRALNLHIGTTPTGLQGLGNLGSGLVLADGLAGAILGGETEADQIISGSNGGYGFLFKDLMTPPSQAAKDAGAINIASITRGMTDFLVKQDGNLSLLPNLKGGFCLQRVQDIIMKAISVGPSGNHGVEILNSLNVSLLSGSIGTPMGHVIQSIADLAGPTGDALFLDNSSDVRLGDGPDPGIFGRGIRILIAKAGGRAFHSRQSVSVLLANMGAGIAPQNAVVNPAIFEQLGSKLEGAFVDQSENVNIMQSMFQGNGASSQSGVGGVMVNLSSQVQIFRSLFGQLNAQGAPERPNIGAAIKAIASQMNLAGNDVLGHITGAVLENSNTVLDGNLFSQQGATGGIGDAIHQLAGGTLEAVRNTVEDSEGAAFRFSEFQEAILRFNNLVGNVLGVLSEQGGKHGSSFAGNSIAGSAFAGNVVAPDNWWGDPSGPGGAGPGGGDPISAGVEATTWLSGPLGVVVAPDFYALESSVGTDVPISVVFSSPLVGDDVVDVTVTDEAGWITSSGAFDVAVGGSSDGEETVELTVGSDVVNRITIHAVSRADNSLEGQATIVISPPGSTMPLGTPAQAGDDVLDAPGAGTFAVGGQLIINPGGANEESAIVSGFGSILIASPLRFNHEAGEVIIPADHLALPSEEDAGSSLPSQLAVLVYPNPVRADATLSIDLPTSGDVHADVFDVGGRRVARLNPGRLPAGRHEVQIDVSALAAGLYLVRTHVNEQVVTKSVVVMR